MRRRIAIALALPVGLVGGIALFIFGIRTAALLVGKAANYLFGWGESWDGDLRQMGIQLILSALFLRDGGVDAHVRLGALDKDG